MTKTRPATVAAPAPAQALESEHEPETRLMQPTRQPRTTYTEDRPQPLMRYRMTITPPWAGDAGVTLETVVLADGWPLDSVGVEWNDLPESKEAGWSHVSLGELTVRMRVIG